MGKFCSRSVVCLLPILVPSLAAADLPRFSLEIPPVRTSLPIADQSVAVSVSGHISMAPTAAGELVTLRVAADLSDLQQKITPILRAQLNQDSRCGERLSVEQATLTPEAPATLLTANVHFEKTGCAKAFGREIVKRLVAGNGVVKVRLTPVVDSPDAVHLQSEVLSVDADGQLGELLHSSPFGAALREKIRKVLTSDLEKSANLQTTLPPAVQGLAVLRSAEFLNGGDGRLRLAITGDLQVSAEQASALGGQLKKLLPR